MKKYFLLIICTTFFIRLSAQDFNYTSRLVSTVVGNDTISYVDCCIENKTSLPLYLWFDKTDGDSHEKMIKDFFLTKKGEVNLLEIIMDMNAKFTGPCVFFKQLSPGKSFHIYIPTSSDADKIDADRWLSKNLKVFSENIIKEYMPVFSSGIPQLLFYNDNSIVIPIELITNCKTE